MSWLRLLTAVGRALDRHWALRLEYLIAENRVLRSKLPRRFRLTDAERRRLGRLGAQLGRRLLVNLAPIAKPETILRWQRRLGERRTWREFLAAHWQPQSVQRRTLCAHGDTSCRMPGVNGLDRGCERRAA
jgi:hypothetical protein